MTPPPAPEPRRGEIVRRGPVAEVWRFADRFDKRYSVLWPWLPLLGLLKANMPTLDAREEAANAERLGAIGLRVPRVLGTRSRWRLCRAGLLHESAVELAPLAGVPLDKFLAAAQPRDRRAVARALGRAVARMHAASTFHRDLYLCHVLVEGGEIGLIDLARARPGRFFRERLRVKDLAALLSSSDRASRADRMAFLRAYLGGGRVDRAFVERVLAKARRLARHGRKG